MTVIGIDASSRKVACFVIDKEIATHTVEVPKKVTERPQICGEISLAMREFFSRYGPETSVFVEWPLVGRAVHATLVQAIVHGVILASAWESGLQRCYSVNVKSWKKDVVGNGNASKDTVRAWLWDNRPEFANLCGDDQDLTDAACIAIYGRAVCARAGQLTRRIPLSR